MPHTLYVRYNVRMRKYVTATEARKQLFKLLEFAGKHGSSIVITLEGRPPVVMLSLDEFEGWQETVEVMSDPKLMKDIKEGLADIKAGRVIPWENVKKSSRR